MGIIGWMLDDITVYPETHHVTFQDWTAGVTSQRCVLVCAPVQKKTKNFQALSLMQVVCLEQSCRLKPANNQIRLNRKVKSSHLRVVVETLFICKLVNDLWLYVLTLFPAAIRVFH